MTGRVVTAQYMPLRPDIDKLIRDKGKSEGRIGNTNSWPIDVLKDGDIYVADSYGKIVDGTLIGDNLGNSIYAHSKRGVIFYGSVRDIEGLAEIKGFNAWVKGYDPSYIQQMMLDRDQCSDSYWQGNGFTGRCSACKKRRRCFYSCTVCRGSCDQCRVYPAARCIRSSAFARRKIYPGQIDTQWTDEIKKDFLNWINENPSKLKMTKEELDNFLKDRTW